MIFQDPYGSLNPRRRVGVDHRRPVRDPQDRHRRRAQEGRAGADGAGRPEPRALQPVPRPSSPAASASASASPGRWRCGRSSSSATSRSPRWTCPSRLRCLTCWPTCSSDFGLSYLFIAHDLEVVRHVSDSVIVMYLGRIAEAGPEDPVYDTPRHPYTAALLSAAPAADPDAAAASGSGSSSPETCRRPSTRRPAAGSIRAARRRRTCAPQDAPRSRSRPATWPATARDRLPFPGADRRSPGQREPGAPEGKQREPQRAEFQAQTRRGPRRPRPSRAAASGS